MVDLGSGDGRNVIAAAKRGARALGVEFNPDMVELSKKNAEKAGVADRAAFVQGDMFEADFSKATVLALFLLPDNMKRLRTKFFELRPGTRIVANTFGIEDWTADESKTIEDDCTSWCTILLWIVPAKVQGTWRMPQGDLTLKQEYQMLTGTLGTTPIENARLRGETITFAVGGAQYTGTVNGNTMTGTVKSGGNDSSWKATRTLP